MKRQPNKMALKDKRLIDSLRVFIVSSDGRVGLYANFRLFWTRTSSIEVLKFLIACMWWNTQSIDGVIQFYVYH